MSRRQDRMAYALVLAIVTPAGFATKLYEGPLATWVNQSFSGVLYVVFWILVVMFIAPGLQPLAVALGVFLMTAALEVTQLWQPPWLEAVRGHFLGRTLLGTTFVPSDFVYYAIGTVMGLGAVQMCRRRSR
ncbi:UNVERIFIED_CONTAM: DUF2809 domain-containing protein [Spiribacter pallidus]